MVRLATRALVRAFFAAFGHSALWWLQRALDARVVPVLRL